MAPRIGYSVPAEEDDWLKELDELLKAGQFTVKGEQPQVYPGFVQQGDPEAPYFTPDPAFKPPLVQGEAVPVTGFGPDDVPITPTTATQMGGAKQEEQLNKNLEESAAPPEPAPEPIPITEPDPFTVAAG